MAQDRMNALGAATGEKPGEQSMALPAAPDGVAPEIWTPLVSKPPVMSTGNIATPQQYGKAVQTLRDNPTPEMMTKFDKWFGGEGHNAKDVLGKLNPQLEKKEAAAAEPAKAPEAPSPSYSIHDEAGPGPAGYLGNAIRGIVPEKVQDYLGGVSR